MENTIFAPLKFLLIIIRLNSLYGLTVHIITFSIPTYLSFTCLLPILCYHVRVYLLLIEVKQIVKRSSVVYL